MELEKLNLVELNAQEVRETEAGYWAAIGAWYLWEWINNPSAHSKALAAGYNTTSYAWD
nr:hypothetical protein [uncultured Flavobacterium sp.]